MISVSELVTNAVRHARWPTDCGYRRMITIAMAQLDGAVIGEVRDLDARLPVLKPHADWSHLDEDLSELSEGGEGLRVVAGLADKFGARLLPAGKSVWFLLHTSLASDGLLD
jgi:anti-sigma regulatory factor (Ser/Thr protein kinase)